MFQTKKIILIIFSIILLLGLFCIPASAVTPDTFGYTFNIQQPVANSNSGYIEMITENWGPVLMYFNASYQHSYEGDITINDGAFNFYATIDSENHLCIRNQGSIYYTLDDGSVAPLTIFGFYLQPQGYTRWGSSQYHLNADNTHMYTPYRLWLGNAGDILYARGYNINLNSLGVSSEFPPFIYGSDVSLYYQLQEIETLLRQNGSNAQAIINNANQNASNIQSNADKNASNIQSNADKNASQIQQNQDKNTQSIIDNQNQLQENEKAEAQGSGNSAADNVTSAVPDQSAGFISALQTFVNGMSTTDTECTLKIPAIVIPEIPGLFSRTVLIEEQDFSFSQAINLIPNAILQIVRALTTIGLIVYCFKQLYDTIEYILTMRRGSSNE